MNNHNNLKVSKTSLEIAVARVRVKMTKVANLVQKIQTMKIMTTNHLKVAANPRAKVRRKCKSENLNVTEKNKIKKMINHRFREDLIRKVKINLKYQGDLKKRAITEEDKKGEVGLHNKDQGGQGEVVATSNARLSKEKSPGKEI
jgi:hypothetical protein